MVKLEEVPDEDLYAPQTGPEEDWDTSSETSDVSEASDVSSVAPDETLYERLTALQDMVPPAQRRFMASAANSVTSWVQSGYRISTKCLWVVSTSALLLGVPFALAYNEEQQVLEMEREMKMQQSANELVAPGSQTAQPETRPAL
ncbi:uncharacterized protein K452DRAFT_327364 [Aplosporella prunicola CBS 121167]|uniref:Mitochondrial import receptor subunit Tom22 n=1 Tax=Aplosporella prunicola CBS 121167 TaxID=1176127 RepID=A0A6A6BB63_9PEZI|nr:uncharacterized protein K452DRAFT_327364 [Aplosporella prunicola CBS 121167]KAF2140485.1 hypothetical protein K452DRAFT_327364 [Aplosporella prunicola CBS 121167]